MFFWKKEKEKKVIKVEVTYGVDRIKQYKFNGFIADEGGVILPFCIANKICDYMLAVHNYNLSCLSGSYKLIESCISARISRDVEIGNVVFAITVDWEEK